MKRIRIATGNPGKLKEFRQMLEPLGYEVMDLSDLPNLTIVEDGDTFDANAVKKARTVLELTGEPTVADDSGLVVDALDGRPGVYSARYAEPGPDQDLRNNEKLLQEMQGVSDKDRTARFVCSLAYCEPGAPPKLFGGKFEGSIGHEESGRNGFGYDPLFLVEGRQQTSAELTPTEKNEISHRAKALTQLLAFLKTHSG